MAPSTATSRAGSTDDVPALKFENNGDDDGDGSSSSVGPAGSSATMTSGLGTDVIDPAGSYTMSYFAPLVDPAANAANHPENDDVPMADAAVDDASATDDTPAVKREPSPPAVAVAATVAATSAPKKSKASGGAATKGSTAAGRGRGSRGGGKRGGGTGRGGVNRGGKSNSSAKPRGGSGGGSTAVTKKTAARRKPTASPSPVIKRESGATPSDGDDDERDNEEEAAEGNDADDDEEDGEEEDDDDDDASDNGPYCICRGPDDHRWMIQCDQCEDWFHGDCVSISKEEGEHVIHSYICPNCTVPGRFVTRFRKLCAQPGCRKPARLYAADGTTAAAAADASYFCGDAHRDQWWDALLARIDRGRGGGGGGVVGAVDKLAVDQLTPAQLLAVLAHSDQPGVAQMLLHGLVEDNSVDRDALLTDEERAATQASAAERYHLADQVAMCKQMLRLLDMAKTRSQEAVRAGALERDCCGYDARLQHVGVQPHFARFLASPEGAAIFAGGDAAALGAPRFDETGEPLGGPAVGDGDGDGDGGKGGGNGDDKHDEATDQSTTAGMCRKRKCKAHAGWFATLARDVRMQMQECARQAGALRDNETRIRRAAVQRAFVARHTAAEVRYVGDSDNSLSSLAGESSNNVSSAEDDDDDDDDDDDMIDMVDDESTSESGEKEADGADDGHRHRRRGHRNQYGRSRSTTASPARANPLGKYGAQQRQTNGTVRNGTRGVGSEHSVALRS